MSGPIRSRTEVIEESIDFSECDTDEMIEHLEGLGYSVLQDGPSTFEYVEHLLICGQVKEAKKEALRIVSALIGRNFK